MYKRVWKCPGEYFGGTPHYILAETQRECSDHPGQMLESVTADEALSVLIQRILELEEKVLRFEQGAPQGLPQPMPSRLNLPPRWDGELEDDDEKLGLLDRFINWCNTPLKGG